MGDDEKPNGHAEASTAAAAPPALKRGRIGELAGEEKKLRRRSSIGSVVKNDIPQPPGQLYLRLRLVELMGCSAFEST